MAVARRGQHARDDGLHLIDVGGGGVRQPSERRRDRTPRARIALDLGAGQQPRLGIGDTLRAARQLADRIGRFDADVDVLVGQRGQRRNQIRTFEPADRAYRLLSDRDVAIRQPLTQRRQVGVGLRAGVFGEEHPLVQHRSRLRTGRRREQDDDDNRGSGGTGSHLSHST